MQDILLLPSARRERDPLVSFFFEEQPFMNRRVWLGAASLMCLGVLTSVSSGRAMMVMAPQPIAQRVASADCIVVGKVTGFTDKTVSARAFPGAKDKTAYQVAIVQVEKGLYGAKGKKEIKVGFIPPPAPGAGGGPIRIRPGGMRAVTLTLNQEACLFLTKHHEGDFYVMPAYFSIIDKKAANFANDVKETERCLKLLADPKAGLEAKEKADRILTAGMLMSRFRQYRPSAVKPEMKPIDPELSKKILLVLADADWTPPRPGPGRPIIGPRMTPQTIFYQLQLKAEDGWTQPKDLKQVPEKAKEWCKENAGKYVIKRFVYESKDKKDDK
jgi:hypothetical protein